LRRAHGDTLAREGGFCPTLAYTFVVGILNRISTLIKSNLNSAVDKASDPGREIDILVADMEANQKQARGEVQSLIALEKRDLKRAEGLKRTIDEWTQRAERALQAGDENLAKEALGRRVELESELRELEAGIGQQRTSIDELTIAVRALDQRVTEFKSRKETMKIEARNKKQKEVGGGAFERYDKLVTDVDVQEAEVALTDDLLSATHQDQKSLETERRFDEMDKQSALDDKLAALKEKLKSQS